MIMKLFRSRIEKTVLVIWLITFFIILGISIYVSRSSDIWNGLLLGCWAASLPVVISVALSYFCSRTIYICSKLIWIMVSLIVIFGAAIYSSVNPNAYEGSSFILVYIFLVLAFPISLLAPVIFYVCYLLFPNFSNFDISFLLFMWFCYFIAGYVQWFIFLPWFFRKLRAKKEAASKE